MTDETVKASWWQKLDKTAKKLIVLLTLAGMLLTLAGTVGGWFVAFTTNIRINERAVQKTLYERAAEKALVEELRKRVQIAEADAAVTKAATATAINEITLTVQGQSDVNAETARQVKANAAQLAKTQEQLLQVSDLSNQLAEQKRELKKLAGEVNDLTKATTKLRKKVKEDPTP